MAEDRLSEIEGILRGGGFSVIYDNRIHPAGWLAVAFPLAHEGGVLVGSSVGTGVSQTGGRGVASGGLAHLDMRAARHLLRWLRRRQVVDPAKVRPWSPQAERHRGDVPFGSYLRGTEHLAPPS